jgi:beta-lactamase regulating signal transducer with metallopeptidase domain
MLDSSTDPVLSWLLRTTWEASILILLAGLLQWVFRKQLGARWRHALWLLVVVRLLLPVSLPSPFSLYNFTRFKFAPAANSPYTQPASPIPEVEGRNVPQNVFLFKPASLPAEAPASMAENLRQKSQDVPFLLLVIWLLGAAALVIRILGQDFRFAARVGRTRMVTDPEVLQILDECRRKMRIRFPLSLLATDEVETPALYGVVHPRLLVPEGLVENFSAEELRHIFLHELAHVKRRDLATHWLMTLAQVVHWFNPLVWLALGRMQVERELACDALALEHDDSRETQSYGRTLIKLMERLVQPRLKPGVVGFLEGNEPIKERIQSIATFEAGKTSRWQMLAAVPLFLLGLALLTDAKTSPKEPAGLVGLWTAEGSAADSVAGHDGVLRGEVGFAPGKRGKAFDLNGRDQFIEIESNPELNPAGSFSISLWIYPRQDRLQAIVSKWVDFPGGANERSYYLRETAELGLAFAVCDLNNQWNGYFHDFETKFQVLKTNAWNHVTAVYDQPTGTRQIYVDGMIVAKRVDPPISIYKSKGPIGIGGRMRTLASDGGTNYFDGLIDEVGFYSRALTPAEAMFLYQQGGTKKQ